ncbi:MAG: inositol monophosphatase, partial [Actinobacteria bacterium]|nr:inositol monophosphatase [Actinomycetota bacterium]
MSSTQILELAESVAKKAGEFLMQRLAKFEVTQKSSAVDFATQMDKGAEELIVSEIIKLRPDDGIIA